MTLSFGALRPMHVRGFILSLAMWLCMVTMAHAHASLHVAEPRDGSVVALPPASIKLYFSEPVSPTRLTITMPDGRTVALGRFAVNGHVVEIDPPEGLAKGTYLVSWRVVSDDGHPVGGTLVFSVGQPQAAETAAAETVDRSVRIGLWLGRIGLYTGLLLGTGGVFAIHVFCRGAKTSSRMLGTLLGIGLLGTIASTGFQGLDTIGGTPEDFFRREVWQAGLTTSFGPMAGAAVAALILAGSALAGKGTMAAWLSVAAVMIAAIAPSLSGHASTAEPEWLMRGVVFVHVAGATLWAGALIPLAKELRSGRAGAGQSLRRFSRVIPFAVFALFISGGALAFVQVRTIEGLSTNYGTVLMIKLGLLLAILALAAFNRWRLTSGAANGEAGAIRLLVRLIVVETLIIVAVLAVVAAWRFTPPPRTLVAEAVAPSAVHLHGDQAMAMLTMKKDPSGRTTLSASIMAADFSPLPAQEVRFVISNPAAGIEPLARQARKDGETGWVVDDLTLPVAAPWKIRIEILVDDFTLYAVEGEIAPPA